MPNRVFFPQAALDQWIVDETVELSGAELTIRGELRRYRLAEAIRVVGEVTGSPDAHELVGHVKSKTFFEEFGAEIMENSMIMGENAYDVVPGWLGLPVGSFDEHASASRAKGRKTPMPKNDEDLLERFLAKTL